MQYNFITLWNSPKWWMIINSKLIYQLDWWSPISLMPNAKKYKSTREKEKDLTTNFVFMKLKLKYKCLIQKTDRKMKRKNRHKKRELRRKYLWKCVSDRRRRKEKECGAHFPVIFRQWWVFFVVVVVVTLWIIRFIALFILIQWSFHIPFHTWFQFFNFYFSRLRVCICRTFTRIADKSDRSWSLSL